MKRIIIRLDSQSRSEVDWAEIDERSGAIVTASNSLAEIGSRIDNHRVTVLLPGSEVLMTRVTLPGGNRKRQVQAVPYILEDSLASDVEELHFALGGRLEDNTCAVAVISKKRLDSRLTALAEAGIEPDFMVSEVLAVPYTGTSAVLVEDGKTLCRTGTQSGFAFETAGLEGLQVDASSLGPEIRCYGPGSEDALPAAFREKVTGQQTAESKTINLLASGFSEDKALNLLQGDYSPHAQWKNLYLRWRLPAGLALAALILFSGLQVEQYYTVKQKNTLLGRQIERLYREVFPEAQKIVNPRAQMKHRLQQLREDTGATGGFLPLLRDAASDLNGAEGFRLDGLHFHDGGLDLEIRLADLYVLDDLKKKLTDRGLTVNIRTASSMEDEVQARLQIRENSS